MSNSSKSIALCVIVGVSITVAVLGCQGPENGSEDTSPSGTLGANITPSQELELERIATLGYVSGVESMPARSGVLIHRPDKTDGGYTLYTSAEAPYALLIDMAGDVVHSWHYPGSKYWARAHVFDNGDLLAITCGPPRLLRLDSDSNLLWKFHGPAHHDFALMPDEMTLVLARTAATRPYLNDGEPVIDDSIVWLDPEGRYLSHISLLEAFERATEGEHRLVDRLPLDDPDIFHTNSVEVLWKRGRPLLLLSIRRISTVAILDVDSGEIVWALWGQWHKQHEAQLVDGNLVLFDNLGLTKERTGPDQSRVLEVDAESLEVVWSFTEPGFFTRGRGAQQRLPNGNTLITESEAGRVIEITPSGRIVWEYVNPATVRERPHLLSTILRAERIPASFPAWSFAGDRRSRDGELEPEMAAPPN